MSRSTITEAELIKLNALVDGELDNMEAAELRLEIAENQHLADAYEQIQNLKNQVVSLRSDALDEFDLPRSESVQRWRPTAIAASLLITIGFASLLYFGIAIYGEKNPKSVLAWHQHFSEKHYIVEPSKSPGLVSFATSTEFGVPDLKEARLYLVDQHVGNSERPEAVFHYRGLKGCRLTIYYSEAELAVPDKPGQIRVWKVGPVTLVMIASGMDNNRFQAVGDYVESVSRQNTGNDQRLAMGEATLSAKSCA